MNPNWNNFVSEQKYENRISANKSSKFCEASQQSWISALQGYAVLSVSGEDAASFLQGQITSNVLDLKKDTVSLSAFCNPKGRVIASFTLVCLQEMTQYWLVLPSELVEKVEKKLRMYVLRSKVIIENHSNNFCVFGISSVLKQGGSLTNPLTDLVGEDSLAGQMTVFNVDSMRWMMIGEFSVATRLWKKLVSEQEYSVVDDSHWVLANIQAGIPSLTETTSELFVPQMLNLDALQAISFEKGCYTGQEVVARMHYLGKLKRRMYLAKYQGDLLPVPSEPVYSNDDSTTVGQIVNIVATESNQFYLLAVIQIDQARCVDLCLSESGGDTLKFLNLPYTFEGQDE